MMDMGVQIPKTSLSVLFFLCFRGAREQRPEASLPRHEANLEERNYGFRTDRTLAFQLIKPLDTAPLEEPAGDVH